MQEADIWQGYWLDGVGVQHHGATSIVPLTLPQ